MDERPNGAEAMTHLVALGVRLDKRRLAKSAYSFEGQDLLK